MASVHDILSSFKKTIDPDSFYIELNDGRTFVIARSLYDTVITAEDDEDYPLYQMMLRDLKHNNPIVKWYYKNTNGNWVDWVAITRDYRVNNPVPYETMAVNNQAFYAIDKREIKECEFIDSDNEIHFIAKEDGAIGECSSNYNSDLDLSDPTVATISQINMSQPNLAFSERHKMSDLKVEILVDGVDIDEYIFWLNGLFVDIEKDPNNSKIFYIRHGKMYLGTTCRSMKQTFRVKHRSYSETNNIVTATTDDLDYEQTEGEWRYSVDLRAFGWAETRLIGPTPEAAYFKESYTLNDENGDPFTVSYKKVLLFNSEMSVDRSMFIESGRILSRDEYEIAPDSRSIRLRDMEKVISNITHEFIQNGVTEVAYRVQRIFDNLEYKLVTVDSKDPAKRLILRRDRVKLTNFPFVGEVSFDKFAVGDIVTIGGFFRPYVWNHRNTIFFHPVKGKSFVNDYSPIDMNNVERISVCTT